MRLWNSETGDTISTILHDGLQRCECPSIHYLLVLNIRAQKYSELTFLVYEVSVCKTKDVFATVGSKNEVQVWSFANRESTELVTSRSDVDCLRSS